MCNDAVFLSFVLRVYCIYLTGHMLQYAKVICLEVCRDWPLLVAVSNNKARLLKVIMDSSQCCLEWTLLPHESDISMHGNGIERQALVNTVLNTQMQ